MDLTLTEEQQAISDLATRILDDHCSPEQLRAAELEESGSWSSEAWAALASAGLLGIGLPEAVGGGGFGLCETSVILQAVGRAAAPLPGYATLILGAGPIAEFGSDDQRARWLPGVIDGSTVLTAILTGRDDSSAAPLNAVRASTTGGRRVSGEGWYVPYGSEADAYVVPVASADGEVVLAVIGSDTEGITTESLSPMSAEPSSIVRFDNVDLPDDALLTGSSGTTGDAHGWLRDRGVAATCIAQAGTCEGALALTASYVSTREQFGVKIATLQAVSQRAADAYIDTELVRLSAWSATWQLAAGHNASRQLCVAKYFAAEAAQRVVAGAQHLHGGIGMDLDYPVHRYFRWAKVHEQRLGGGTEHLAILGRLLAHERP